jgi:hypothetical protein
MLRIATILELYGYYYVASVAAYAAPALPLFAINIAGLGLLGWRRKRKAQAIA